MNIDLLSKMVKELILDNDRVVLPGFGVFTAEIVPASFSGRGYILNPPYRKLHFRAASESDDMLASIYSSSNSVSMDVARKIVSDFTAELRQVLIRNRTVTLPGLGRIRTTKENNFFFVPDADLDIYPEGFGLEPISLKAHVPLAHQATQANETVAHDSMGSEAAPAAEYVGEESSESMEVPHEMTAEQMAEPVPEAPVPGKPGIQEKGVGTESGKSWKKLFSDRRFRTVMLALAGVLALAVLALIVFLVLADLCPDFIDSILYNEAELEILNY